MLTRELKDKFVNLASELSPENLCCDGELSQCEVNRKHKRIMQEWRKLEVQAGCEFSEEEVWGFFVRKW